MYFYLISLGVNFYEFSHSLFLKLFEILHVKSLKYAIVSERKIFSTCLFWFFF